MSEYTIDIGSGHSLKAVYNANDQLVGYTHVHPDARDPSVLCRSFCAVRSGYGPPPHTIAKVDPLTLTPSLECRACKAHGHVTDGKWVPA